MPPSIGARRSPSVEAGKDLGIEVEPIGKNDYARLAEYDGPVHPARRPRSRTTPTALPTRRRGRHGGDRRPASILRCTNKIYLHAALAQTADAEDRILYATTRAAWPICPNCSASIVLKIPDGSFSRGIVRWRMPKRSCDGAWRSCSSTPPWSSPRSSCSPTSTGESACWNKGAALCVPVLHVARSLADLQPRGARRRQVRRLQDLPVRDARPTW